MGKHHALGFATPHDLSRFLLHDVHYVKFLLKSTIPVRLLVLHYYLSGVGYLTLASLRRTRKASFDPKEDAQKEFPGNIVSPIRVFAFGCCDQIR